MGWPKGFKREFKRKTWKRRFKDWNPDAWVVFGVLLVTALTLIFLTPIRMPLPFWLSGIGMIIVTVGLIIIIGGQAIITAAHEKGAGLVTNGIYKYSRNPMYLGFVMLFFGLGLGRDRFWFLVVGLITPYALNRLVLPGEEQDLAARFGKAWQEYASKTPRWLKITL